VNDVKDKKDRRNLITHMAKVDALNTSKVLGPPLNHPTASSLPETANTTIWNHHPSQNTNTTFRDHRPDIPPLALGP
jgi:hypothetical protein